MKYQISAVLLGLAATTVSAADGDKQDGPFTLRVKGTAKASKIDGYATACHAGAAIEGLCYAAGTPEQVDTGAQFFFNYTGDASVADNKSGLLTWNLIYNDDQVLSQPLGLAYSAGSNVAPAIFGFDGQLSVGFDEEKSLFAVQYGDDSKNTPSKPPKPAEPTALYQWALCWQYVAGSPYVQSISWVQSGGAPHNPTCETVELTQA